MASEDHRDKSDSPVNLLPDWLRLGLIITYSISIILGSTLIILRNMPENNIQARSTANATEKPDAPISVEPTATISPTPDIKFFYWYREQESAGEPYYIEYSYEDNVVIYQALDITSAEATWSSDGLFEMSINMVDVPEEITIGSASDRYDLDSLEFLWSVWIDTDGSKQTGYNQPINGQLVEGIDASVQLGNRSGLEQTLRLINESELNIHEIWLPNNKDEELHYTFDSTINSITLGIPLEEMTQEAKIYIETYLWKQEGPIGFSFNDQLSLFPAKWDESSQKIIPIIEAKQNFNPETQYAFWEFEDKIDTGMDPFIDLIRGDAELNGRNLELRLYAADIPKNVYYNRDYYYWEIKIDLDGDALADIALEQLTDHSGKLGEASYWAETKGKVIWGSTNFCQLLTWDVYMHCKDENIEVYMDPDREEILFTAESDLFTPIMDIWVTVNGGEKINFTNTDRGDNTGLTSDTETIDSVSD